MKQLVDLMREATEQPPAETWSVPELVGAGRRRVRRRRAAVTGGAALAAAVVGAAVVVPTTLLGGGGGTATPAAEPPGGQVLRLADAVPLAQAGPVDLGTLTNAEERLGEGSLATSRLTPDGLLLARTTVPVNGVWPHWALVDPAHPDDEALPVRTDAQPPVTPLTLGRDRLVFLGGDQQARMTVWTYDRTTHQWLAPVRVDASSTGLTFDTARRTALSGGRLWFAVNDAEVATGNRDRLWSVPLSDPTSLRDEGLVGAFAVGGGTLTYVEPATEGLTPRVLHERPLGGGAETVTDAHTSPGCNVLTMERVETTVAVVEYCGTHDGVRDDRVVVLDRSRGNDAVTVEGSDLWLGTVGARFVGLQAQAGRRGSYVYDVRERRLVRLGEQPTRVVGLPQSQGDLVGWAEPPAGGGGTADDTTNAPLALRVARLP